MGAWLTLTNPVKQVKHISVTPALQNVTEEQDVQGEIPWIAKTLETTDSWPGYSLQP